MRALPLDYAPAHPHRATRLPILPRPSRRTLLLTLLTAATLLWLALRHDPWRHRAITLPFPASIPRITFTPPNRLLLVDLYTACTIDPDTGRLLHTFGKVPVRRRPPPPLALFPLDDGRALLEILDDRILLHDTESGAQLAAFNRPTSPRGPIRLWTLPRAGRRLFGEVHAPPDPDTLSLPRRPIEILVWDLDPARAPDLPPPRVHRFLAPGANHVLSPDAHFIAIYSNLLPGQPDDTCLFDFESAKRVTLDPPYPGGYTPDAFSADSRWFFIPAPGHGVTWGYSTRTGQRLPQIADPRLGSYNIPATLSPDARYAATAYTPPPTNTQLPILSLYRLTGTPDAPVTAPIASRRTRNDNYIHPLFSPDGTRLLACAAADSPAYALYDIPTLRTVAELPVTGIPERPAFSPDGRHVVATENLMNSARTLHLYTKTGLECRESALGILGMPHAWLLLALLTATSLSLHAPPPSNNSPTTAASKSTAEPATAPNSTANAPPTPPNASSPAPTASSTPSPSAPTNPSNGKSAPTPPSSTARESSSAPSPPT